MHENLPDHIEERDKMSSLASWTRRYAQNRVMPQMILLGIFCFFIVAILASSFLGTMAYRAGNRPAVWLCIIIGGLAIIGNTVCAIWFAVPGWGDKQAMKWANSYYSQEGDVKLAGCKSHHPKWVVYLVASIFGSSILVSVVLGFRGFIPQHYMQPVSAMYCVPFLLFLYFWQRPAISPIVLLWPFLYALHAILILAGAPVVSKPSMDGVNMFISNFGYGLLTMLLAHVYGRLALRRLKAISRLGLSDQGAAEKEPQP